MQFPRWAGAVAVVLLAGLVRLHALDADPTTDFGAAHLTDEGYYAKNAKELLRSGSWVHASDNHNHVLVHHVNDKIDLRAERA